MGDEKCGLAEVSPEGVANIGHGTLPNGYL